MHIAIIADIHANLAALQAVLRHAEGRSASGGLDALWCLGDTVGYGPDPNSCLALLRQYEPLCVVGNHDLAAVGLLDTGDFNPDAATAALWTAGQLGDEERQYLSSLPQVVLEGDFTLVHGTLRAPVWEYLYSREAALAHLQRQETPFGLVGHTHIPTLAVIEEEDGQLHYLEDGTTIDLTDGRFVFNPGGVGQPRDGDPRASYALYDVGAGTLAIHRVEYDIAETQKKMAAARLPARLIQRLRYGR